MSRYADKVKDQVESGEGRPGFKPHPTGEFNAVVEDVVAKTSRNGNDFFEIHLRTPVGKARVAIWPVKEEDIKGKFLEIKGGDLKAAEKMYDDQIARHAFLYKDLGLPLPQTEEEIYANLGRLRERPCHISVQHNKKDENNPNIYINAPRKGASTGVGKVEDLPGKGPLDGAEVSTDEIPF